MMRESGGGAGHGNGWVRGGTCVHALCKGPVHAAGVVCRSAQGRLHEAMSRCPCQWGLPDRTAGQH